MGITNWMWTLGTEHSNDNGWGKKCRLLIYSMCSRHIPSQYKRLGMKLVEHEEVARFTKGLEHSQLSYFIPGFALRKGCDIFPLLGLNRGSELKFCVDQGRYTQFSRRETSFGMGNTGQMN